MREIDTVTSNMATTMKALLFTLYKMNEARNTPMFDFDKVSCTLEIVEDGHFLESVARYVLKYGDEDAVVGAFYPIHALIGQGIYLSHVMNLQGMNEPLAEGQPPEGFTELVSFLSTANMLGMTRVLAEPTCDSFDDAIRQIYLPSIIESLCNLAQDDPAISKEELMKNWG